MDERYLEEYNFKELGQIYVQSYKSYVASKEKGLGLGFGDFAQRTEELEIQKRRLEIITEEFSSRSFKERLVVYKALLAGVVDLEDEGDYESAIKFNKMAEEFYRTILD
jgi:hypothetical protein